MHVHALRCFGAHPGAGNPALVIEDDASSPAARQAWAHAHGATCVWIDPAHERGVAALIDFYYPHARSPLCLHATLAVARLLLARGGGPPAALVKTALHGLALGLVADQASLFVRLAAQVARQPALADALAARLLGLPQTALATPARVASVGSPKLLVQVREAAALHAIAPDLAAISAWSRASGINGVYAWCRPAAGGGAFEGRNFNHLDPLLEDSATGVAAGALTTLLGHGLALRQGRATGHDCLIQTRIEAGAVWVGGRVEPA